MADRYVVFCVACLRVFDVCVVSDGRTMAWALTAPSSEVYVVGRSNHPTIIASESVKLIQLLNSFNLIQRTTDSR